MAMMEIGRETGVVQSFREGWGFIRSNRDPDGGDLFVHFSNVVPDAHGNRRLHVNDVVSFVRESAPKGARASDVRRIDAAEAA